MKRKNESSLLAKIALSLILLLDIPLIILGFFLGISYPIAPTESILGVKILIPIMILVIPVNMGLIYIIKQEVKE